MMRYEYKVTKQGTRMDDEPLYGLTIINNTPDIPKFMKTCQFDELTQYELDRYKNMMEKENVGL